MQLAHYILYDLRKQWPSQQFEVVEEDTSVGKCIDIYYHDGPVLDMVYNIIAPYQMGYYNEFKHEYVYLNASGEMARAKHITVERLFSTKIYSIAENFIKDAMPQVIDLADNKKEIFHFLDHTLHPMDLTAGFKPFLFQQLVSNLFLKEI